MQFSVLLVATICIGLSALDGYAISSLLLVLSNEFRGAEVGIVAFAYPVVGTVAALFAGGAINRWGAYWPLTVSLGLFGLGALVCAVAPSMNWLSLGRAIQGAGGGALTVGALSLITAKAETRVRVRYLSNIGLLFAICSVLGPGFAGLFHSAWSWRAFFAVQIPIVATAAVWIALAGTRGGRTIDSSSRRFGTLSGFRLSVLIALSVFWIHFAVDPSQPRYPLKVFTGLVLLVLVIAVMRAENRDAASLLPSTLFRSRGFQITNALLFGSSMTTLGLAAFVPSFVQSASNANVAVGGLSASPYVFGTMAGSLIVGRTSEVMSTKAFVTVGFLTSFGGYLLLGTAEHNFALPVVLIAVFLVGTGYGIILPLLTSRAQSMVHPQEHGSATALASVSRSFGAVVGVAVFGALLFAGTSGDAAGIAAAALGTCADATRACEFRTAHVRESFSTVLFIGGVTLCVCAAASVRDLRDTEKL